VKRPERCPNESCRRRAAASCLYRRPPSTFRFTAARGELSCTIGLGTRLHVDERGSRISDWLWTWNPYRSEPTCSVSTSRKARINTTALHWWSPVDLFNIMVEKCQALLHSRKSRPENHPTVGRRDHASAVPSATGRRRLATFGSAIVATCGTLSIRAASALPVCTDGQWRLASRATNGHRILIGIPRSEPLARCSACCCSCAVCPLPGPSTVFGLFQLQRRRRLMQHDNSPSKISRSICNHWSWLTFIFSFGGRSSACSLWWTSLPRCLRPRPSYAWKTSPYGNNWLSCAAQLPNGWS